MLHLIKESLTQRKEIKKMSSRSVHYPVSYLSVRMKLLLAASAACLIAATAATTAEAGDAHTQLLFARFQAEHGKVYTTRAEESHRFSVFANNVRQMREHNAAGHSYKKG